MSYFTCLSLISELRDFLMDRNKFLIQLIDNSDSLISYNQISENFLSQILLFNYKNHAVYSTNAAKILDELKVSGHKQVCQYQFKKNDIVWICRQCQRDETCVLCNNCFQNSNHDGHEVYFYHSASGGCCDCGDAGAWDSNGFCNRHGNLLDDPTQLVAEEIVDIGKELFDMLAECIVIVFETFKEYCMSNSTADNDVDRYSLKVLNDDVHTFDQVSEAFSEINIVSQITLLVHEIHDKGSAIIKVDSWIEIKSRADMLRNHGLLVAVTPELFENKLSSVITILKWLYDIANISDGFCRMICNSFDSTKLNRLLCIDSYLPKQLNVPLHHLFLTLMADTKFKATVACCYADSYPTIVENFGKGIGTTECSLFGLSVQFLNRDVYANEMIASHNFLYNLSKSLKTLLLKPSDNPLNDSIILYRRYSLIIGDYKIVFSIPHISRLYLKHCIDDFLDILCHYQRMHPQVRKTTTHVTYEDTEWMMAFNLSVGLGTLHEYLLNWLLNESSTQPIPYTFDNTIILPSVTTIIEQVINRLQQISVPIDKFRCSFHILLHRFLSSLIRECLYYPHHTNHLMILRDSTYIASDNVFNCIIETILSTVSFAAQISVGLWKRNGRVMLDQLLNYNDPPFGRIFRDLDILLLQYLTYSFSFDRFIIYVLHAYNVYDFVTSLAPFPIDDQASVLMLDEMLLFIIHIVTNLPVPPDNDMQIRLKPTIRKSFIHILAKGPATYSQIVDGSSHIPELTKMNPSFIESILKEISTVREGNGYETFTNKYVLNSNEWINYDSKYSYLQSHVHNNISENRPKITINQPIVCKNQFIHPIFSNFGYNLLSNNILKKLIYKLLLLYSTKLYKQFQNNLFIFHQSYQYVDSLNITINETTFLLVIQILTIFVHEWNENNSFEFEHFFMDEFDISQLINSILSKMDSTNLLSQDGNLSLSLNNEIIAKITNDSVEFKQEIKETNDVLKLPSLLSILLDTIDSLTTNNSSTSTVSTSQQNLIHWLGWIIDECKMKSITMKEIIIKRLKKIENFDKMKLLEKKKLKAKEKALNKIKLSAQSFTNFMDKEIDDNIEKEIDNNINNKLDNDQDNYAQCIICHATNSDNIGYLAFTQTSKILTKKIKQLHLNNTNENMNCQSYCYVNLCGHSMHYSCYDDFYATVVARSDLQNNLIIDTTLGQFQCPLCKKLNNMIVPYFNVPNTTNRKRLRDDINNINDINNYKWIIQYLSFPSLLSSDIYRNIDMMNDIECDKFDYNTISMISNRIRSSYNNVVTSNVVRPNNISSSSSLLQRSSDRLESDSIKSTNSYNSGRFRNFFHGFLERIYPSNNISSSVVSPMITEDQNMLQTNESELILTNLPSIDTIDSRIDEQIDSNKIWHRFLTELCDPTRGTVNNENIPGRFPSYVLTPNLIKYLVEAIQSISFTISIDDSDNNIPGYFLLSNSNIDDSKLFHKLIYGLVGCVTNYKLLPIFNNYINTSFYSFVSNYNTDTDNELINNEPMISKNLLDYVVLLITIYLSNLSDPNSNTSNNIVLYKIQYIILIRLLQLIIDESINNYNDYHNELEIPSNQLIIGDEIGYVVDFIVKIISILGYYYPNITLSNDKIYLIIWKWMKFMKTISQLIYRTIPDILIHPTNHADKIWVANTSKDLTNELVINMLELYQLQCIIDYNHHIKEHLILFGILNKYIEHFYSYTKHNNNLQSILQFIHSFDYPLTNQLTLIDISKSYTILHGQVSQLCNFEFPAICLFCGKIIDGSGKGYCTAHIKYCNGETGMFFLVQDCNILITHGPRACYLPAPYIDEFGERHRHHRGKPLNLDHRMYELLRKLWTSHNIPREVVQKRSNSTRVIISGHY